MSLIEGGNIVKTNAGYLAPGQTNVSTTGQVATLTTGAKTVPLRTVTAGKTYMMTDLYVFCDVAANAPLLIQVQVAGTTVFYGYCSQNAPLAMPGIETQINGAAGQQVNLILAQTTAVQNVAFYAGQVEF